MNKCLNVIGVLMGLLLFTCCSKETPKQSEARYNSESHAELAEIDSLMWRQPDSALAVMMDYFAGRDAFNASPENDTDTTRRNDCVSTTDYDRHYAHLLTAELLYKNDYAQTNRAELQQAVVYFDSLVCETPPFQRGAGGLKKPQSPNPTDPTIAFLDARAHYINGVGYYENDSVVEACAEYLKALEVMEERFEGKELVGHKARFMAYTYNRLGDLFSEQFMMESAIACYENALIYCRIEPTSLNGVSNILYRIGKQYNKLDEIDRARQYYGQAMENIANTDNSVYRDIVSSKALCDYLSGSGIGQPLKAIRNIADKVDSENERLNRFLTTGWIFFHEGVYDSALYYLEPVFENNEAGLQAQAAGYLRIIYDSIGDVEKSNICMRLLTNQKKSDGEKKALVSRLEDLYKNHSNKKLEQQANAEREEAVKRAKGIIIPIAVAVVLTVVCVLIIRSRKLLEKKQAEADRAFGEAEQEHEKELRLWQAEADKTLEESKKQHEDELKRMQAENEQQLQEMDEKHKQWMAEARERQEEELRVALENAVNHQHDEAALRREAFLKEPICQHINELLHGRHITTRDSSYEHEAIALKEEDYKQLKEAVERHYEGFDNALLSRCPSLRHTDLALCHLHLMGLGESEIAALRSRTYSGIKKHNESIQEKLGTDKTVAEYVLEVAEGLCGNQISAHIEAIEGTRPQKSGWINEKSDRLAQESGMKNMQKSMQKIVNLISASPDITLSEMASQLDMSRNGVDKNIRKLKEQGIIRRVGPDKGGHWEVIR